MPPEAAAEGDGAAAAGFATAEDGEALAGDWLAGAAGGAAAAGVALVDGLADWPGADTLVGAVVAVDAGGAALDGFWPLQAVANSQMSVPNLAAAIVRAACFVRLERFTHSSDLRWVKQLRRE